MSEALSRSALLATYDPFRQSKEDSYAHASAPVQALSAFLMQVACTEGLHMVGKGDMFATLMQVRPASIG